MRTEFGKAVQADLQAASTLSPAGVGDFFRAVAAKLTKSVKQAVDSPEERRAIEDDLLNLFDTYAAPALPALIAKPTREYLLKIVDSALVAIGS